MSWEKEKGPEDEKLWWGFMLGVEISPHCRPLWLTHHSPLLKESKGGQWLPANRTQVEKETKQKLYLNFLFLQMVSLPQTLRRLPVIFNREAF